MSHPIQDSLIFLNNIRENICESLDNMDDNEVENAKYFIMNEATDFQILHLITLGDLPENEYDINMEIVLWEYLKESVIKNYDELSESIDKDLLSDFIYDFGPTTPYGYSSADPILETHLESGMLSDDYLDETFGPSGFEIKPTSENISISNNRFLWSYS